MPPRLALLICTSLVLFLLRLEHKSRRTVSPALWIPTLWFLMVASRSLGAWFGVTGNNDSGNLMDQVVLSGLTVSGLAVLARRRFPWSVMLRRHAWLLALLGYMLLSTFWSEITLVAMKRWIREVIVVIMAFVAASEKDPREALASLMRRCAYVLIPFSWMLIKYFPELGRQYGRWSGIEMWTGVTSQKNGLGRLCMISLLFLLWSLYERWRKQPAAPAHSLLWPDISVIALGFYLLIGADSSTSLATLVVGSALFLGLRFCRKLNIMVPQAAFMILVIFLMAFGTSTPLLGGSNVAGFTSSLGRDDTLTGRTEVWAAVIPAMKQQPLLGYGFGSFWTDARRELYEIPTAHNGYLDILLEQGVVGLCFYAIWLLSCVRQLHLALKSEHDWASLAICFLIIGLLYNITESALNSLTEHMTAVVVLFACAVPYRGRLVSGPAKTQRRLKVWSEVSSTAPSQNGVLGSA